MKRSRSLGALIALTLVLAVMLIAPSAASAVEVTYPGPFVLDANDQSMNWDEVWDLTAGDVVLRYRLDMSQITQPRSWPIGWVQDSTGGWWYDTTPTTDPTKYPDTYTPWVEVGMRGVGGDNFNPGPAYTYQGKCGGWMTSESDDWLGGWSLDEFGKVVLADDGVEAQDGDDKHSLASTSGVGEWHYDVEDGDGVFGYDSGWDTVLPMFGSHDNHGLWYDRDSVDQWQATAWENSGINAGRINTEGIYDIEIIYHAIDDGLGVMFARVNGVMQGFYKPAWHGGGLTEADRYPAGLSFKGDMKQMQVFAGSFAYDPVGWDYGTVELRNIIVSGTPGVADPLTPDFTYTADASGVVELDASSTRGGMGPYTYMWDFNNDGVIDETTTNPKTSHDFGGVGDYTITLTADPNRCKPYAVTKTVTVEPPPVFDICGYKYLGDTDTGIAGWIINLYQGDVLVSTTMTGEDGKYCFHNLSAGTYTVSENPVTGWDQVYPAQNAHVVVVPGGETVVQEGVILYGTQLGTAHNGLYEINLDTSTATLLFEAGGTGNSPNALGFDSENGRLYYMKVREVAPYDSDLYFWELGAATETLAGLALPGDLVVGADFYDGAYVNDD